MPMLRPIRIGALPTVSTQHHAAGHEPCSSGKTPAPAIKIVTGENAVLLEQLRTGALDLVVGRLAAPEQMTGFSFEHLYSEQVIFVRARRPSAALEPAADLFARARTLFLVLMPTRASIIRPFVERFLIANGISGLPTQIETVSDSFGRAFVRQTDAIWIISAGVVATDLADSTLAALPIDTSETKGPVGLTVRADSVPSMPLALLMRTIREAASDAANA